MRPSKAIRTCSALGLANMVPLTAAVNRPFPTNPAKEGSWPAPPPEIIDTVDLEEGRR